MTVSKVPLTACPDCGGIVRQDEDVLDTWFSSALWPFSTLGFPKDSKNLNYFYPSSVLVTAYDIIFFWVARMIFSGIEFMHDVPFHEVLIHGIVRDDKGRKMSKSLGNGVDPLELIDKYGADALRLSLSFGIAPGSDTRFSEEKIESSRNFCNKLWNASRFVIMNLDENSKAEIPKRLSIADKWVLTKLNAVIREVTKNLNRYEIGLANARIYDFVWNDFCDWYIESQKPLLYSEDKAKKQHSQSMLLYVLNEILKLLHPFAPFITEEIFGTVNSGKSIMVESWPEHNKHLIFRVEAKNFDALKNLIIKIRNARSEIGIAPSKKIKLYIVAKDALAFNRSKLYLEKLAGIEQAIMLKDKSEINEKCVSIVGENAEAFIPFYGLIDVEKEIERLTKEIESTKQEVNRNETMLQNEDFVKKAPQRLVDAEREKLERNREKLSKLSEKILMFK